MNGQAPRLILAGVLSGTFLCLGADLALADPEPSPVGPTPPPAYDDPPPPPPPAGLLDAGFSPGVWDQFFPKCWPAWEPPGASSSPLGDVRVNNWWQAEYSPCPAPPAPPPGQPYPPLPPPPLTNPWCGPADPRPSICFPGQAYYSRVVPPGYYGPPSWYPSIGVPLWMPP
jgi:hypothetical protein